MNPIKKTNGISFWNEKSVFNFLIFGILQIALSKHEIQENITQTKR